MPEGETPININLCCYDDLVDCVKPGDRCEIVGIFRAASQRINMVPSAKRLFNADGFYRPL